MFLFPAVGSRCLFTAVCLYVPFFSCWVKVSVPSYRINAVCFQLSDYICLLPVLGLYFAANVFTAHFGVMSVYIPVRLSIHDVFKELLGSVN